MDLASDADEVAGKPGGLVHRAPEPENKVLVNNARIVRWAGPALALFTVILLPWTIYLGFPGGRVRGPAATILPRSIPGKRAFLTA